MSSSAHECFDDCCIGVKENSFGKGVSLQHAFTLGTSSHNFPQKEAIPAANQWTPKENIPAMVLGLVKLMSVYLKVINIDCNTWI